nr:hypothetical protein [Streptomyces sp. NRRL S-15]
MGTHEVQDHAVTVLLGQTGQALSLNVYKRQGRSSASSDAVARSKRASPSSVERPVTPPPLIRRTSASLRCPVIPLAWAQNPQASVVAGRPPALRWWARASW